MMAVWGRMGQVRKLSTAAEDVSTASMARSTLASRPPAPFRATIALCVGGSPAAAAMCAITRRGGANNDPTRHRPRHAARTGAPWHTRTASPPGRPTNPHWMAAPVGRECEHDDENGDARAADDMVAVSGVVQRARAHDVGDDGV